MNSSSPPRQLVFDPTPEIFASDSGGLFFHELKADGTAALETAAYDEIRFVVSLWHPAGTRSIDLDRAYVELVCAWGPDADHWIKLAEIEPVVSPHKPGKSFDGWIVLPVLGTETTYALSGSGFEPRARLQIRASAYLVA